MAWEFTGDGQVPGAMWRAKRLIYAAMVTLMIAARFASQDLFFLLLSGMLLIAAFTGACAYLCIFDGRRYRVDGDGIAQEWASTLSVRWAEVTRVVGRVERTHWLAAAFYRVVLRVPPEAPYRTYRLMDQRRCRVIVSTWRIARASELAALVERFTSAVADRELPTEPPNEQL